MRAGTLRHSITVEQTTQSRDTFGGVSDSWATFVPLRARKAITGGREFVAAQQRYSEMTALFVTRYVPGVTTKMRVNHGGTYYDILAAYDPVELGKELQIVCKVIE